MGKIIKEETVTSPPPGPEKNFRILNTSNQMVYVLLTSGSVGLSPGASHDVPASELSYHVRIMARRGHVGLFEK